MLGNRAGSVALNMSVVGYVSSDDSGGSLVPARRTELSGAAPLTAQPKRAKVQVAGLAGVPTDARAVVLNVRRSSSSAVTTLWTWPSGSVRPTPSSWRYTVGGPASGRVIVPIGRDGSINVAADRAGRVVFNVVGYVANHADRLFRPVTPSRLGGQVRNLASGGTRAVSVRGQAGVPRSATAVVIQVSGLDARRDARLTVWPRGKTRPTLSDLVVPKHRDRDGLLLVPIGEHGDIRIHADGGRLGVKIVTVGWIS